MNIFAETAHKHAGPVVQARQIVHIPTTLVGVRNGSYTRQVRTVSVLGTVEVQYSYQRETRQRLAYGMLRYKGMEFLAVQTDEDFWEAFESRQPV